ncbi:MAG: sulfotransferase domain-containing protein [Longimicrobiales bacterium]
MGAVGWIAGVGGLLVVFFIAQMIYLSTVLTWEHEQTRGLGYYGKPPAEREQFRATLRRHARLLYPILRLLGRFSNFTFDKASFRYQNLAGPRGTCSEASFAAGHAYTPRPEDIFVVTQMKCGTTWMQHVVYETLHRGDGNLVEAGSTLYAVSPWLESEKSVSMADAPLLGRERPSRVIKTHFPVSLCPYDASARYIYVARHPVSCFASCADFVATNASAMAPEREVVEQWFCSNAMWWGSWPAHVRGWFERAETDANVLFVHFETMRHDLPSVVRQVAAFLGLRPLTDGEVGQIAHKCGFAYMQENGNTFEMNPPHLLQTDAELFVRGTADRHGDVPAEMRERILAWCVAEMDRDGLPLERIYRDGNPAPVI